MIFRCPRCKYTTKPQPTVSKKPGWTITHECGVGKKVVALEPLKEGK